MRNWIANAIRRITRGFMQQLQFPLVDAYLRHELRTLLDSMLYRAIGGALHSNTRKRTAEEIADAVVDALWRRLGIEPDGSHPAGD